MATHQDFKLAARVMVDGRVPGRVVASTPRSVTVGDAPGHGCVYGTCGKATHAHPEASTVVASAAVAAWTTLEVVCYLGIVVIGVLAVAGLALAVLALPLFFLIAASMRRR